MALNLNDVRLAGYLGDAPEIRYFPDGTATTTVSLATTKRWTDKKTQEKKERTDWHRVVFNGRSAENAGELLKKGSHIYVVGELRNRSYEKDGQKRYVTEVVGIFQMIDRKPVDADKVPNAPKDEAPLPNPDDDGFDSDIPF